MNKERIKEVFSDIEFVKELFSQETPEEVKALLAEKGMEVSVEDIVKVRDLLIKKVELAEKGECEELDEEELGEVSGGVIHIIVGILAPIVIMPLVGGAIWHSADLVQKRRW